MDNSNEKKKAQLGMPHGTANNRLRKAIIFSMAKRLGEATCFQCGDEICDIDNFSIEHKIPYLDSCDPVGLFFGLDNIAFSHLSCNVAAARPPKRSHPSASAYKKGCRCADCRECFRIENAGYRLKRKLKDQMLLSSIG